MTSMSTERRTGLDRRQMERRAAPVDGSDVSRRVTVTDRRTPLAAEVPLRAADSLGALAAPGLLMGAGFAALMDTAVFHHLLRWHHLASDTAGTGSMTPEDLALDGIQELIAGIAIAVGVILLWNLGVQRSRASWRAAGPSMFGWVLLGWALFNLVFVSLPQWVFDRHHINVENDPLTWDLIFLAATLVIGVVGIALVMSKRSLDISDSRQDLDRRAE